MAAGSPVRWRAWCTTGVPRAPAAIFGMTAGISLTEDTKKKWLLDPPCGGVCGVPQVHPKWIPDLKRLPPRLEAPGPDGSPIWAHLDAVQTPPWDLLGCLPSTEPVSRHQSPVTSRESPVTRHKSRVKHHGSVQAANSLGCKSQVAGREVTSALRGAVRPPPPTQMPETYLRPLAFPRRGSPDALIRNLRGGDDFLGPGSAVRDTPFCAW